MKRLDGVDDAHLGRFRLDRCLDCLEVRLGHDRHPEGVRAEPLCSQLDLRGRLFAGDVQNPAPGAREVAEGAARDRRLADAGRAADEHHRPGHEAAAQHPVELADPRLQATQPGRLDVGERHRLEGALRGGTPRARGRRRGRSLLHHRVPLAAAGTAAVPFGAVVAALRADEEGGRRHPARLSTSADVLSPYDRRVRKAVVMIDAGFEAILATVLLMGVAYADIDERDFPGPASDLVIGLFALALYVLALVLATLVKNEQLGDRVLAVVVAVNAVTALVLLIWVLAANGFSPQGRAVTWVTIAALLVLATAQAFARRRR